MTKSVTRLYNYFQPAKYGLALNIDRDAMTFSGRVMIRGKKVGKPSQRLTFHQKGLKITQASVTKHDKKGDQQFEIGRINNQDTYDEVRLHSEATFYPGEYTVVMDFTDIITKPMHGIYPCAFTHEQQAKKLIASQFESHHAREAFPCVDEPEAKATFDLTMLTTPGELVLSNTPEVSSVVEGDKLVTTFETTPKMSPYLLAFVTGEMGFTESSTKNGTVVRSYATPDNAAFTQYSVDAAVKILEFFEDYFATPYPLPKLDLVGLPDFAVGAMENWGLITFREQVYLVNEAASGIETKQIAALVIAHEISHQWFGNLVTMKWWDDLWLNESFANMMEYVAVDAVYPEWNVWEQFVSHEGVSAKRRDSLVDVQSVHTEVNHPDEINTIFDPSIVYAKGGTLLHMLLHYIGEDAFRSGLQAYFKQHAYGNTVAADLWTALSASSGQDVGKFMANWLDKPGYPIVNVSWEPGDASFTADQTRFLTDPNAVDTDKTIWQVPLASTVPLQTDVLKEQQQTIALEKSSETLLLNHDGTSYFLPRYANPAHLQQIVQAIGDQKVSTTDRLLLLDNYILLQRGGQASSVELLDLVKGYTHETNENVWGSLAMSIAEARRLVEGDEKSEDKLNELIRSLVEPLLADFGWDDKPDDDAQTLHMRGLLYSMAVGAKSQPVIDEALLKFAAFKKPGDLSASTRGVVYFAGARHGSEADFERLLALHESVQSAEEKEELAGGLTSAKRPDSYKKLIKLLTSGSVRNQDLTHWYIWLLRNRYSRTATWQWLQDEWPWIVEQFGSDKGYSSFARYSGSVFSYPQEYEEYVKFFRPMKSEIALNRDITLAEQEMQSRLAWRKRNEEDVKKYLKG